MVSDAISTRVRLFTPQFPKPSVWPQPVELPEMMPQQVGINTCWAAVGVAVTAIFGGSTTQCRVIERVLGRECCDDATDYILAKCDRQECLPPALGEHFDDDNDTPAFKSESFVKAEIGDEVPIGVRINWKVSNSGHFVLIVGYVESRSVLHLLIDDPKDGWRRTWRHDRFVSAYDEVGEWHITFETKKATRRAIEPKHEQIGMDSDDHSCRPPC